jgi:phosphohistidine phosphatase
LRRLRLIDESAGAIIVIGHNPGLHELALALAAPDSPRYKALATGKFPTTARASFAIDGTWSSLGQSRHALTQYVTAKSLGDQH